MKDLFGMVIMILLAAIMIGAGVLSLDKMAFNVPNVGVIVNESLAVVNNTNIKLSYGNLTRWNGIINVSSATLGSSQYSIYMTNGSVTIDIQGENSTCGDGDTCYASYEYNNYMTPANSVLQTGRDEVGNISVNWLGIVITIAMVGLLIGLLVTSFLVNRR